MMTDLQQKIMNIVWLSGGFAFGGTARDLLRGEQPNDLDIRLGHQTDVAKILQLGAAVISDRAADHGEAYYDQKIVFDSGEECHVKYGWCSVTDCDINLVRLFIDKVNLLYVPLFLKESAQPLLTVLNHIRNKEFVALRECEEHRKYRWDEFVKRGWTKL